LTESRPDNVSAKLNILGREISIVMQRMDDRHGEYDDEAAVITIDPRADYWQTLLHEVAHAVFYRINFHVDVDLAEIVVDTLATAISENFRLIPKS